VNAKTPSEKKKPPIYRGSVAPVINAQINPMAPLTNSNITNISHLSTNNQERKFILLTIFSLVSGIYRIDENKR
jgi:hypothetical protein